MKHTEKGIWEVRIPGDLSGFYYTYSVMVMCKTFEAADPYARSSGINGMRSMILDPARTNPEGWDKISYFPLDNPTDAVLYEVHVRDITIHESSGVINRGKYLGLAEKDTRSPENMPTGLSHLMDLGITHVHLMPVTDFWTIDESKPIQDQYNWGYDPTNFNVPEGSYASDPSNGYVRVKELKQMIQAIKSVGIGVVLDIVYTIPIKRQIRILTSWFPAIITELTASAPFQTARAAETKRHRNAQWSGISSLTP
jgi:pullulanase